MNISRLSSQPGELRTTSGWLSDMHVRQKECLDHSVHECPIVIDFKLDMIRGASRAFRGYALAASSFGDGQKNGLNPMLLMMRKCKKLSAMVHR